LLTASGSCRPIIKVAVDSIGFGGPQKSIAILANLSLTLGWILGFFEVVCKLKLVGNYFF
jgi:hypothetical protein